MGNFTGLILLAFIYRAMQLRKVRDEVAAARDERFSQT
jgi:hypothetical protein